VRHHGGIVCVMCGIVCVTFVELVANQEMVVAVQQSITPTKRHAPDGIVLGVWVHGCMGVWVHGCMGVWIAPGRIG